MVFSRGMGWIPSKLDHRDEKYAFTPRHTLAQLDDLVVPDLGKLIDWRYDQKMEGSCTAQSSVSCTRFERMMHKMPILLPSRNFVYWNARALDDPPNTDSDGGAEVRNAVKGLANYGFCEESMWGYSDHTMLARPPLACFNSAVGNEITTYHAVNQDAQDLRSCLASMHPFVFGIEVFHSMMSDEVAQTGIVPMPTDNDKPVGGHAILCVSYLKDRRQYKFLNSWGRDWGDDGFGYLPEEFVESQYTADDFWMIQIDPNQHIQHQPEKKHYWWDILGLWN